MTTTLLQSFGGELNTFLTSGDVNLKYLAATSDDFLQELKQVESELELEVQRENDVQIDTKADFHKLDKGIDKWYKDLIDTLKHYNTNINRFQKNVLHASKFNIDIDEAYRYPLNLDSIPVEYVRNDPLYINTRERALHEVKQENQQELMKAIILHLLKTGQSDIIKDMMHDLAPIHNSIVDQRLLDRFKRLNEIVDDIVINHKLEKALDWFQEKYNESRQGVDSFNNSNDLDEKSSNGENDSTTFQEVQFKFHALQFVLLLNGDKDSEPFQLDNALKAYIYSKENFDKFYNNYLHEISPLMTLLVFGRLDTSEFVQLGKELIDKMRLSLAKDIEKGSSNLTEVKFIQEILNRFEDIHSGTSLFLNLSNEFISYYCKDMNLSNDSSLFQSLLAGFINLPNFYKYNKIQHKFRSLSSVGPLDMDMGHEDTNHNENSNLNISSINGPTTDRRESVFKITDNDNSSTSPIFSPQNIIIAPYTYDLPFQLPDVSRFLFKYHPIFICPVSKEQLIPLTVDETGYTTDDVEQKQTKRLKLDITKNDELLKTMHNPAMVLKYCRHIALKESLWQLSKRGAEVFKCHYCYKKHKLSEVSEGYFIDL